MAVPVLETQPFRAGVPVRLFRHASGAIYDVAPDGQRFLVLDKADAGVPRLNLIQNWFEDLKARLPGK